MIPAPPPTHTSRRGAWGARSTRHPKRPNVIILMFLTLSRVMKAPFKKVQETLTCSVAYRECQAPVREMASRLVSTHPAHFPKVANKTVTQSGNTKLALDLHYNVNDVNWRSDRSIFYLYSSLITILALITLRRPARGGSPPPFNSFRFCLF